MNFNIDNFTDMILAYSPKLLGAILTLVLGFWIANIIGGKLRNNLEKRKIDKSLIPFLTSFVVIGSKVLILLSAASMFGFEVTSFVAIFGALAFAIGMALQGNLSHMAAGILILFLKPFKVGDFIVTNGYSGTVTEIQIFNTILTTLDNRIIIIPNGKITSEPLENLTKNEIRKVPMTFGISYGADIDQARKIIKQVADSCPQILHDKGVDIFVSELGDSSVNFAVRPWSKTEDFWTVNFFMHEHIKKEFDKNNIGIPFPQMDVHMHSQN